MSNNNRFNLSREKSFYDISNKEDNSTKDTFLKNASNIIVKDYNNIRGLRRNNSIIGGRDNESINPFVMDSRIKDLESKISTLEEANKILIERINNSEKNFAVQIKQIEVNNQEEKQNRYKSNKVMNIISEQNIANSNDLNMKINILQERMMKGDENKMQQRQFDLESQKYLIGKLTEKITKTVKSEVEARYKADIDGKIFSQKLGNKFDSSIEILKKEIEEITNQTRVDMQNISKECSERTHNVSKYIDQQIQEAIYGKGSANEELKNFVRKLTEQIKTSLLSISKKHEMFESRLNNLENKDEQNKNDFHNFMNLVEQRLMKKINDVKLYTEKNITKHDLFLEQNMNEITSKIGEKIQFLAGQLIDTRKKTNERFEEIFEDHHNQFKKICEDMEEICKRIYKYEYLIKEYENKYNDIIDKVNKSLANMYAREDVQIIQERIIKTIECNFLQEQINEIHNALQLANIQFNDNINELNKGSQNSFQFLQNQLKEQKDQLISMGDNNVMMFEEFQKSTDNIEVKQIVNEMVTKVDNLLVMESLQNSKNAEYNIMRTMEEHKNNIMNSINEINNNKEDISLLKDKVSTIQDTLNESGKKISGMKDQMQNMQKEAHELEMKESIKKVMNSMITNIENSLTKEKMDKMSQFDLNKMTKTLIDLEDKYNSLSNTNTELESIKENINQLNAQQEILKKEPKGGDDIKLATMQMLNNVEFDNIYSLLNSGQIGTSKEEINMKDYNQIIDNKINSALEKIKKDNEDMWVKCVSMKDKVTDPEEIRKILREVKPSVMSLGETQRNIMGVNDYNDDENYAQPKLNMNIKNDSNYDYENKSNNQKDPGPDINSKKSSKKSKTSIKNKNNPINSQEDNKINNDDKKAKDKNKKTDNEEPLNELKDMLKYSEQPKNDENKSNNEKNSSKKNKENNNPKPIQISNDEKSKNLESGEEEEYEEEDEEIDDEGENEQDLKGELKSKNVVSGKSKPKN